MVERDYTDYIAEVFGYGERVFHLEHFRQLRHDPVVTEFQVGRCTYLLNKDRAMKVKWAPWKKWNWRKPVWSVNEFFRTRKIGLIVYREPPPGSLEYEDVITEIPESFKCKICDFKHKEERVLKGHVTKKHKGAKHQMVVMPVMKQVIEQRPKKVIVEPYHISRMHQPSGRLR